MNTSCFQNSESFFLKFFFKLKFNMFNTEYLFAFIFYFIQKSNESVSSINEKLLEVLRSNKSNIAIQNPILILHFDHKCNEKVSFFVFSSFFTFLYFCEFILIHWSLEVQIPHVFSFFYSYFSLITVFITLSYTFFFNFKNCCIFIYCIFIFLVSLIRSYFLI